MLTAGTPTEEGWLGHHPHSGCHQHCAGPVRLPQTSKISEEPDRLQKRTVPTRPQILLRRHEVFLGEGD